MALRASVSLGTMIIVPTLLDCCESKMNECLQSVSNITLHMVSIQEVYTASILILW